MFANSVSTQFSNISKHIPLDSTLSARNIQVDTAGWTHLDDLLRRQCESQQLSQQHQHGLVLGHGFAFDHTLQASYRLHAVMVPSMQGTTYRTK